MSELLPKNYCHSTGRKTFMMNVASVSHSHWWGGGGGGVPCWLRADTISNVYYLLVLPTFIPRHKVLFKIIVPCNYYWDLFFGWLNIGHFLKSRFSKTLKYGL